MTSVPHLALPQSAAGSDPLGPTSIPRATAHVLLLGVSDVLGAGLAAVLQGASGLEVSIASPSLTLQLLAEADVVVFEAASSTRAVEPASERLVEQAPGQAVLALVAGETSEPARYALLNGAHGIVSTDWPAARVVATVLGATEGRFVRPLVERPGQVAVQRALGAAPGVSLTYRELAVLELVAAGLSNQQIAEELFVSVNTVKTYIRSAYRRLGVTTRSQAIVWCFENGLPERTTR